VSLTDLDGHAMAAHTKVDVGYNIQIAAQMSRTDSTSSPAADVRRMA
jgi:hypothetical protein